MTAESKSGYKHPPEEHRFKPGSSGNPRGRSKGSPNLRTDFAQLMTARVPIRENGKPKRITRQQAMLLSLFDKAVHGDVKAITSIINMMIKLDPTSSVETAVDETLAEVDNEIVADFLRRNQPTNS